MLGCSKATQCCAMMPHYCSCVSFTLTRGNSGRSFSFWQHWAHSPSMPLHSAPTCSPAATSEFRQHTWHMNILQTHAALYLWYYRFPKRLDKGSPIPMHQDNHPSSSRWFLRALYMFHTLITPAPEKHWWVMNNIDKHHTGLTDEIIYTYRYQAPEMIMLLQSATAA